MHFKIPPKVQVGGVDFHVKYRKGLARNANRRGETQFFDRLLSIDPDLLPEEKESTFIHEVTHAIEDTYACDLSEKQVRRLSQGVYQVIRQLEPEQRKGRRNETRSPQR